MELRIRALFLIVVLTLTMAGVSSADETINFCASVTLKPDNPGTRPAWSIGGKTYGSRPDCCGPGSTPNGILNENLSHEAGKAYCASVVDKPWFTFTTSGQPYENAELHLSCCPRPAQGEPGYNADMNRLLDAAVESHDLMKKLQAAQDDAQLISVAKANGYTLTQQDIDESKQAGVSPAPVENLKVNRSAVALSKSSCGGLNQDACVHCKDEVCVYWPFNFCCIKEKCDCVDASFSCDHGLVIKNGKCVSPIPTPTISVSDLPTTIDIPGTQKPLKNIVGKKAVVTHADYANYYVPNGKTQAASCTRLASYKTTMCNSGDSSCSRLTQLSNTCSSSQPTCNTINIKDNNNNKLPFALYTLQEWNTLHPGGLKVNANWFDIDGPPNFPHISPCTNIYGFSENNGSQISSASQGDPVGNTTNLLDALVITSHSLPDGTTHKAVAIVANRDIAATNHITQAVGGFIILQGGKAISSSKLPSSVKPNNTGARSGVGIKTESDGSQTLYFVVVQPGPGKAGMTAKELALYLKSLGASDGINLDNSGSSQLLYNSPSGVIITEKGDRDQNNKLAYRPIPNFLQVSVP